MLKWKDLKATGKWSVASRLYLIFPLCTGQQRETHREKERVRERDRRVGQRERKRKKKKNKRLLLILAENEKTLKDN